MAARLLRLDSASTSSPPSTASSSSTSKTRVRGLESVSILDRETLYQQDLRRSVERIPETKLEPEPEPPDHSPSTVVSWGVRGGFARPPKLPPDGEPAAVPRPPSRPSSASWRKRRAFRA